MISLISKTSHNICGEMGKKCLKIMSNLLSGAFILELVGAAVV